MKRAHEKISNIWRGNAEVFVEIETDPQEDPLFAER